VSQFLPNNNDNPNVNVINEYKPTEGNFICSTCRADLVPIEKNRDRYWHCCYCQRDYHTTIDILRKASPGKVKSIMGGTLKTESSQLEQTVFIEQTKMIKSSSIMEGKELENDSRIPRSVRAYAKVLGNAKLTKYSDDKLQLNA
jgi:NDP-sugar pyrophosphorylase family protein